SLDANIAVPYEPTLLILDAGADPQTLGQQIELFKERCPNSRVAVVANHDHLDHVISAFRKGANAYFVKVTSCDAFTKSLELVMLGETILPPAILPFILDCKHDHGGRLAMQHNENGEVPSVASENKYIPQLSTRENCILQCIIEGSSNKG